MGFTAVENQIKETTTPRSKNSAITPHWNAASNQVPVPIPPPVPPPVEMISRPGAKRMVFPFNQWRIPTPIQTMPTEEDSTKSTAKSETNQSMSESLLQGEYDAAAGRESFLAALDEWRGTKIETPLITTKKLPKEESLLVGSYDADESRESFAKSLAEWRESHHQNNAEESIPNHAPILDNQSTAASSVRENDQQTAEPKVVELDLKFQKQQSYLDKLILASKKQKIEDYIPIQKPAIDETIESHGSDDNLDDEDETFLRKLALNQLAQSHDPAEIQIDLKSFKMIDLDDEERGFMREIMASIASKQGEPTKNRQVEVIIEDITNGEDEFILSALSAGRMVECIPASKLVVIEPINH